MNITVTKNQVSVNTDYILNDKEYNVNQCYFTFSDEYTDNLVKKAIFVQGTSTIEMSIINNQCQIPAEVLNNGQFELRVYAYEVDGDELLLRYSPSYTTAYVRTGSYIENAESPEVITPTQFEQYMQAMNDGLNEVANVDIDATQTSTGGTVTITNRYGEEKTVVIKDGEKGETGATPNIQIGTVVTGDHSAVTRTGTNENPIFNFILEKGDKGDTGNGIASVTKTSTSGLTDTYTITYTNGTTTTFDVTNGKGITNIAKTSTSGLEDTYTITYNDNTISTFTVTNGNGISSIEKTGTQDNVDTYTIYYTNGTTSTFTVTNSTVTNQEFEELKSEHEELVNTLPRVEGTGESITLDNTAQYKMNVALSGNTSQTTYTGRNKANFETINYSLQNSATGSRNGQEYTITCSADNKYGSCRFSAENLGLKFNTTYTFSALVKSTTSTTGSYLYVYGGATSTGTATSGSKVPAGNRCYITFTTPSSWGSSAWVGLLPSEEGATTVFTDVMIEESATMGDYEPYVGGMPSPNPLYPQPIKKVTGNNSITVCGKNFLLLSNDNVFINKINNPDITSNYDESKNRIDYKVNSLPQSSSQAGYYYSFKTIIGKTYKVKCTWANTSNTPISNVRICSDTNATTIINNMVSETEYSFTSTQETYYFRVWITNKIGNGYVEYAIVSENDTTFEPYQSQTYPINLGSLEYCKIGDYSDEFALSTGKNLFESQLELGSINNSGKNVDNDNTIRSVNFIPVESNTQYTFNNNKNYHTYLYEYDENKKFISATIGASETINPFTFITSATTKYIRFRTYTSSIENDLTVKVWLNKGNTAPTWEPYGIGNWYLKKNIGKVVLDGTEPYNYLGGTTSNPYYVFYNNNNQLSNSVKSTIIYSNYFIVDNSSGLLQRDGGCRIAEFNSTNRAFFCIHSITSVNDFKTWLTTHNTTIYYPLATSTGEPITDTTLITQLNNLYNQIKSYKGQTNITQTNAEIPFNIDASALYDLNNLISRVATLETEV